MLDVMCNGVSNCCMKRGTFKLHFRTSDEAEAEARRDVLR